MLQVCYVVVGSGWDRHSQMAWVSAQSVRRQEPNARIIVVVEGISPLAEAEMRAHFAGVADAVIAKTADAPTPLAKSRVHKILLREYVDGDFVYLDSDTLAVAPFAQVLDAPGEVAAVSDFNFEIAKGWFPKDVAEPFRALGWDYPLPYFFNAGVIFLRDTPGVRAFAKEWLKRFHASSALPHVWDQATLNSTIFATKVPHVILPHGFNAIVVKRNYRFRDAKILHFFGSAEEQRGTLMEHLLEQVRTTGAFDDAAYDRAIRQRHPWGPDPQAWQLIHSRNYLRAAVVKTRQASVRILSVARSSS